MLASITPLGERGRNRKWSITVAFYLIGSLLGGAALGGLFGIAGQSVRVLLEPSRSLMLFSVMLLGAVALVFDSGLTPLSLPTIRRQVNEDWLTRYRAWVYGFSFGAQLGFGLVTVVTTAAVYLV